MRPSSQNFRTVYKVSYQNWREVVRTESEGCVITVLRHVEYEQRLPWLGGGVSNVLRLTKNVAF